MTEPLELQRLADLSDDDLARAYEPQGEPWLRVRGMDHEPPEGEIRALPGRVAQRSDRPVVFIAQPGIVLALERSFPWSSPPPTRLD